MTTVAGTSQGLSLPITLDRKLAGLRTRVRWLSLAAGAALTVVVLVVLAAGGMAVDRVWIVPDWVRWVTWAAWVLAGAVLVVRCVLLPAVRQMGSVALAASVERVFPELGERLTSSVSLTAADDPHGHLGSPALKEAVVDQATRQAMGLRFSQANLFVASEQSGVAVLVLGQVAL